jgi:pyridinium-3,5-bisthiocarboxylic acid mononucleotide nickel chelatase
MNIAYFDCIAGASGDMILGALIDTGLLEETLRTRLATLRLPGFELKCKKVNKNGFSATKVDVIVAEDAPERHLAEIEALLEAGDLPAPVRQQASAIFYRLAQVESGIHGRPVDQVHLHELGGVDTIVDVTGALLGLRELGIEKVYASPLPLGRGFVRGAHGEIPLPAPATLALLKGAPVVGSEIEKELVTPTGAALLTSLATAFGPIPPMTLQAVGYGAGGRDLPIPNVLRMLLGVASEVGKSGPGIPGMLETLVMLETNVDNLNPEIYEYTMQRLFGAGALDVFFSGVQMKKNRPATMIHVLCKPGDADQMSEILFYETSTLGIRQHFVTRQALERLIETVETPFGAVRVKVARLAANEVKAAPEYEDCRKLAEQRGVPLREVYQAAQAAASQRFQSAGNPSEQHAAESE